ncbi:MAG: hypothetical protein A4E72_02106 [Syntrophus sp. PtaU1.Bin208]|nr:MAG: hypothetical protein A4E72_02106 [Syntrophus sp. PtaU1.Bin208]
MTFLRKGLEAGAENIVIKDCERKIASGGGRSGLNNACRSKSEL